MQIHHMFGMGLFLLSQAYLQPKFWVDTFSTSFFLINRLPMKQLNYNIPHNKLIEKYKIINFLTFLNANIFLYLLFTFRKLQSKSTKYVFLGYGRSHKGFKCLNLSSNSIYISRHVFFYENSFPFMNNNITPYHKVPHILNFLMKYSK